MRKREFTMFAGCVNTMQQQGKLGSRDKNLQSK
jgi:hypothetical protein